MITKNLEWLPFTSIEDMHEQYPEIFKEAFAEDYKDFEKEYEEYIKKTKDKDEVFGVFMSEYLYDKGEDPYYTFGEALARKRGYKAYTVEVHFFDETVEDDGVSKEVVDIEQVVVGTREELAEVIEVYCEENGIPLPEVLKEKLIP